jgi:hypothetical protein
MGLAQGHGGLMDRASWAKSGIGQQPAKIELGQRVKGAATDFVCWAENSQGPKRKKEIKRKRVSFYYFLNLISGRELSRNS